MSIWRIKPVSAFEDDMKKSELKRVLGKWSLETKKIQKTFMRQFVVVFLMDIEIFFGQKKNINK